MIPDQDFSHRASLPAVERLLRRVESQNLIGEFGRPAVTAAIRNVLAELRAAMNTAIESGCATESGSTKEASILDRVSDQLREEARPSLRPVFNLTGTVLHTNLGRAALPEEAIEAIAIAAAGPSNLEYDLDHGRRGDRDDHLEKQICELTGAEAATVVNNNAAAVLLVLNTLALRKEVPASRGELIEIGGSFRMPDIMARAGCRLREIGTTNRTHLRDYQAAIGPKTGLVMKIHTSNYAIQGFTAAVSERDLAGLCHERGVPFAVDLGSGALIDLRKLGLPHEPMPSESLASGADLVTFSGDKLLGGPQAGIIAGRANLIDKIKRNPMKRALRVDKMTVAALSALLRLYANPDRVAERVPTLRILARPAGEIRKLAERLYPLVAARLQSFAAVELADCESQIGSGALPTQRLSSAGLAIRPLTGKPGAGTALQRLARAFRNMPVPVIGRVQDGALILDLRCLEDETSFGAQLPALVVPGTAAGTPTT
jgi:L-seryl-tRNA(Ser) seleniumtransferase